MPLNGFVLNRLLAARFLLDNSGQDVTPVSSPSAVAYKILLAHDAAELTLLALADQFQIKVTVAGKQQREPAFMDLAEAVMARASSEDFGNGLHLLKHMVQVRVSFKHRGLLPDTSSTHAIFSEVVALLESLCSRLLQISLLQVDQSSAIESDDVRQRFLNAKKKIDLSEYKGALEEISLGLESVFFSNGTISARAGDPSSEAALLFSGRGVDPASFLTMQKLLPKANFPWDKVRWDLRKTGHPANWTKANADFCLRTAVSTVVAIQGTSASPVVLDFYDRFEDVIEVIADSPKVFLTTSSLFSDSKLEEFSSLKKGDRVIGKAIGHHAIESERPNPPWDLDYASFVAVESPRHESLPGPTEFSLELQVLWFRKEEVAIDYQISERFLELHDFRDQRELQEGT